MITERDERILMHVGLYTLSIRPVIERLFFDGASCDNVINRLLRERALQANGGDRSARLPGGISYYQLTIPAARKFGFPTHRALRRQTAGLRRDIAVLWFCNMSNKKIRRLEQYELTDLYGPGEQLGRGFGIPHAVHIDGSAGAVLRLYTPTTIEDRTFVRTLRTDAELVMKHAGVAAWAKRGSYRFVVLVDSPVRQERLSQQLTRLRDMPVRCSIDTAPSLDTLHFFAKQLENSDGRS